MKTRYRLIYIPRARIERIIAKHPAVAAGELSVWDVVQPESLEEVCLLNSLAAAQRAGQECLKLDEYGEVTVEKEEWLICEDTDEYEWCCTRQGLITDESGIQWNLP